ncbi:hypothetical protein TPHA_0M02050 [Tetrapisispora phaffii CBS 4417]|uniref:DUF866-domain-containing protein n=1 Tax=Tetrapisispora phaffii (strain ATCC 24235 / CBS 4417 / NBRC 1672 / NRRL Y-8282 / UCD 70-5) TaxID=1071381 RepID=G8C0R4_TETPH|nr:hypothetical protein TPHA_0M02050 [Tetrapisispora phaffii CBS 4417]CCE65779.1 hypothetical protein TPHA_0M02050 [Tetrapisispora phaffii CBS 4417]
MLYLVAEALFSENIRSISVKNDPSSPAEFSFNLVCTNCREEHESAVSINTFEKHDMPGSKGEASFILKCKFCDKDCSVNMNTFEDVFYNIENSQNTSELEAIALQREKKGIKNIKGNQSVLLEFDCRGCEVTKFHISSVPYKVNLNNKKTLEFEFEEGDNEWYDYDDDSAEEVSITEFNTEIMRGK